MLSNGQIRIIAISTEKPVKGISAPTLIQSGLNISLADWRGVFAPPELDTIQIAKLNDLIMRLSNSGEWKKEIAKHKWQNLYLAAL